MCDILNIGNGMANNTIRSLLTYLLYVLVEEAIKKPIKHVNIKI